MADKETSFKESSSYKTLMIAADSAATPLPLKLLRMTRTGQVIEDGINVGTAGLIGSIVGLPRDLWEFGKERIKGVKSATPEEDKILSSKWIEKKLTDGYTENRKLIGRERPTIEPGSDEAMIHLGAQMVPVAGSFFIPGVNGAKLASAGARYGKAGELAGRAAGNLGFQLNAADITTLGIEGAEKLAGIERPTEQLPTRLVEGKITTKAPLSMKPQFSDKSGFQKTALQTTPNINSIATVALVMGGHLRDHHHTDQFDAQKTVALQKALVESGQLKPTEKNPKPVDGIIGTDTINALDSSIKATVNPAAITGDVKTSHILRMKALAEELKTTPANPHGFDPRVIELQTSAYAAGLYNKKIDGLAGPETAKAIESLETLPATHEKPKVMAQNSKAETAPAPVPS